MQEKIELSLAGLTVCVDAASCALSVKAREKDSVIWESDPLRPPEVRADGKSRLFASAGKTSSRVVKTGLGEGILSLYAQIPGLADFAFETLVFIEAATGDLCFEWIPLNEARNIHVEEVRWPAPFTCHGEGAYTALPYMQGILIPNGWDKDFPGYKFNGQLCSQAAYMPWWGQIRRSGGYLAIVEDAPDAAMRTEHKAGGDTSVGVAWLPSLGEMSYKRRLRVSFHKRDGSAFHNYVDLCKHYREFAISRGRFTSLAEKIVRCPNAGRLIGSTVLHLTTKRDIVKESELYNTEDPSKNRTLVTFARRAEQIRAIRAQGLQKAYLHLDGWGHAGYDHEHPDYLPPAEDAGGWEGLLDLNKTCHEAGYLFGLHDQYRDYYLDARTYDSENAVRLADGTLYEHCVWDGGRQNYLCPSLQRAYVERNFEELFAHGIKIDATYLDVFTCNEPDECANPLHRVTRKDCLEYRKQCFDYLISRGIAPSSEEMNDWAMNSLVFCHWAPYPAPEAGVPVPLFNLVYHDCVIIPWMLTGGSLGKGQWGTPPGESGFLHALLNGGIGYFDPDLDEATQRVLLGKAETVASLHEKVARAEMTAHEFLSDDGRVQRTTFSDGTRVTVDFARETYEIA